MWDAAMQDRRRNERAKFGIFREIAKWRRHAPQLMATAIVMEWRRHFFMTRCRRQKHRRRWPGNPNGRSKFYNLCLFTFTRSQLTLQRRLRGWQRSLKRHVADVKNIAGGDQDRYKFHNYENLCLRDQAKPLEKHLFAARTPPWFHCAMLFSYYHFCSHLRKIENRKPPPKNRDIHIEGSFLYILFIAKP